MKCRIVYVVPGLLVALILFFAVDCGPLEMEDSARFDGVSGTSPVDRLESDISGMKIRITPNLPEMNRVEKEGRAFTELSYPKAALFGEEGAPAIPHFGILFAIPQGADVAVEVTEGPSTFVDGVLLMPAQPPMPDTYDLPVPAFAFDEEAYRAQGFLPGSPLYLEDEKIIRGVRVNHLWVSPIRYNAAERRVEIIESLDVTIRFTGGENRFFARPELVSPGYDRLYRRLLINGDLIENIDRTAPTMTKGEGAQFLIITHPDFLKAAKMLKAWKEVMGISTAVATTDEIGESAQDYRMFISRAYFDEQTPLEYLLLLGDAEFVPTVYEVFSTGHFSVMGADTHYGCVDGDDLFADVGVSRISVDTAAQAENQIRRIIEYQRRPTLDEAYYTNSYHFAYFQDDNKNGEADRRFSLTSEEIFRWFSEVYDEKTIVPNRCFTTSPQVNPKTWNQSSSYGFFADWWTLPEKAIPDELKRENGFEWQCHAADITEAVNAGTFFITHRDHGAATGWGDPEYRVEHVWNLANRAMLPVVWSINCQTGWFDNETDSTIDMSGDNRIAFSESWERNPVGGAVGLIASTRISYSGYNDRLVWGWMDALWPGYIPGYPGGDSKAGDDPLSMADVVNYGKVYMSSVYGPSSTRREAMAEFQWFGDPTMKMWLGLPEEFAISHDRHARLDQTEFAFEIEQDGAVVTLLHGESIIGQTVSAGGKAQITLESAVNEETILEVVATKDGYRTYLGRIALVACAKDDDCSDGVFCNGDERCEKGECLAAESPVDCDDGLFCNGEEFCDEETDSCTAADEPCAGQPCDEDADDCGSPGDDDDDDSGGGCGS